MTITKLPKLTEKQFMAQVIQLAKLRRWMVYHTFDSRRSTEGFPDLVLLRDSRLIVAELKVGNNEPTTAQKWWLAAFKDANVAAHIWRETDWKLIEEILE